MSALVPRSPASKSTLASSCILRRRFSASFSSSSLDRMILSSPPVLVSPARLTRDSQLGSALLPCVQVREMECTRLPRLKKGMLVPWTSYERASQLIGVTNGLQICPTYDRAEHNEVDDRLDRVRQVVVARHRWICRCWQFGQRQRRNKDGADSHRSEEAGKDRFAEGLDVRDELVQEEDDRQAARDDDADSEQDETPREE